MHDSSHNGIFDFGVNVTKYSFFYLAVYSFYTVQFFAKSVKPFNFIFIQDFIYSFSFSWLLYGEMFSKIGQAV